MTTQTKAADPVLPPCPKALVYHDMMPCFMWPEMQDYARAAVLADREGRQQWISVEDRLPNTDEIVLVLVPGARYQQVALDCWRMQREAPLSWSSATIEIGMGWDDHEFDEVTHWMPLPAPPADAQRAKGDGNG